MAGEKKVMRNQNLSVLFGTLLLVAVGTRLVHSDPAAAYLGTYAGEFHWSTSGSELQHIQFEFRNAQPKDSGHLTLEGVGHYLDSHTDIGLTADFDPSTRAVEIWERAPKGPETQGFTTDGSHKGHYSADFHSIEATWTQADGSKTGTLHLERVTP